MGFLNCDAPKRARAAEVHERRAMQELRVVPDHHVAVRVIVRVAVLVLRRVGLELVEESASLVLAYSLDGEGATRHRVESLPPRMRMGTHELVTHPRYFLLLRFG